MLLKYFYLLSPLPMSIPFWLFFFFFFNNPFHFFFFMSIVKSRLHHHSHAFKRRHSRFWSRDRFLQTGWSGGTNNFTTWHCTRCSVLRVAVLEEKLFFWLIELDPCLIGSSSELKEAVEELELELDELESDLLFGEGDLLLRFGLLLRLRDFLLRLSR